MTELAHELVTPNVAALGIGAAGMVDFAAGVLRYAPNLPWRDLPLSARLSDAIRTFGSAGVAETSDPTRDATRVGGEAGVEAPR